MPFLEVEQISRQFGGLQALHNVDFHIDEGELVSIVGPNGSGKSTLFNLITGFLKPTRGMIKFKGGVISGLSPYRISREGVARTFQLTSLFENLSVLENVIVGLHRQTTSGMFGALTRSQHYCREEKACLERAREMIDSVGLRNFESDPACQLPSFSRKKLALTIALVSNPSLLLLDEPASGLIVEEVDQLATLLKRIRKSGVTLCVIEHKMKFVMSLSDRVMVLNEGEKIAEGTPLEVSRNKDVIAAYLGK